jgi:hypothetical protein
MRNSGAHFVGAPVGRSRLKTAERGETSRGDGAGLQPDMPWGHEHPLGNLSKWRAARDTPPDCSFDRRQSECFSAELVMA